MLARLGAHSELVHRQLVSRIPSRASRSMFGVFAYGDNHRLYAPMALAEWSSDMMYSRPSQRRESRRDTRAA